jgi:hypothetical protein
MNTPAMGKAAPRRLLPFNAGKDARQAGFGDIARLQWSALDFTTLINSSFALFHLLVWTFLPVQIKL